MANKAVISRQGLFGIPHNSWLLFVVFVPSLLLLVLSAGLVSSFVIFQQLFEIIAIFSAAVSVINVVGVVVIVFAAFSCLL